MVVFTKWAQDESGRLYVSNPASDEQGSVAYLLPAAGPDTPIELEEALHQYDGSFLFASRPLPIGSGTATKDFLTSLEVVLPDRGLLWLTDLSQINRDTVRVLPINAGGTQTVGGMVAPLVGSGLLNLSLAGTIDLALTGTTLTLAGSNATMIQLTGQMAPTAQPVLQAALPFAGAQRGCLAVDSLFAQRRSLLSSSVLRCGFQFVYPNADCQSAQRYLTGWYPLLDQEQGLNDFIGFRFSLDPTDVDNSKCELEKGQQPRTFFAFTGRNLDEQETVLYTTFATQNGYPVYCKPLVPTGDGSDQSAMLVFHMGPQDGPAEATFLTSPAGDFTLDVPGGQPGIGYNLLCGLSGTETVSFVPGDRLRFVAGQPAYAAAYPFKTASTVGPPVDARGDVLKPEFRSSWATVRPAPAAAGEVRVGGPNSYLAQPVGSTLYGRERLNQQFRGMLFGFEDTSVPLSADGQAFPLVPYTAVAPEIAPGWFNLDDYREMESQVVAPTRRYRVQTVSTIGSLTVDAAAEAPYRATTPSGLLVARHGAQYTAVLLAHPPEGPDMRFVNLTPELQQALQTNQLFLVAANAQFLETAGGAGFENQIGIGGWRLVAEVGQQNRYADYSNVLIIKGRRGQSLTVLIGHPELWTQATELAAPSDLQESTDGTTIVGPPNPDEIVVLAQWIQSYIAQAEGQTDPFFDRFKRIVGDPDWTGILVLKASVAAFPDELKGLQGGLDGGSPYAHHLGVDISPVNPDLSVTQPSSIFGLIYYVNPVYDPANGKQPVAPAPGDYDFKLLTLKVLFDHAAVQDFRSLAQLTINQFFNQPVTSMGDPQNVFNAILMEGSYQNHDGRSFYVLDTTGDSLFRFTSSLFNKVEVIKAQFNTVGESGGQMVSRFDLWGFLDFKPISLTNKAGNSTPLDLFSFGFGDQPDATRRGLYFSGLSVRMSFPESDPTQRHFSFDTAKMSFDMALSTPRASSLYQAFPLEIQGVVSGDKQSQPSDLGYLPVGAGSNLLGLRDTWHGLRFRLNMGTAGELAGKMGLNAYLLLGWSPDDGTDPRNYNVSVGLQLPGTGGGAKLFSLQGVLRLAVNNILLRYDTRARAWVLMLTEIALKFLGLLKLPPNGATALSLFGNPEAKGQGSALGWYAIYKLPTSQQREVQVLPTQAGE